ncbi:putative N-acetylated-alpha-linked acidic dipeptidase [Styela clava]|uniref:putative N-acetylated-alpha-linked acidic dipeptidase n=1 Tax=Styela clava TaxID=7725 RepID=UPI00193A901D|nr:putative N-acetylated-alpha-linked acidic dipeptidase [Styela clava]
MSSLKSRNYFAISAIVALVAFGLGIIVGVFGINRCPSSPSVDEDVARQIRDEVKASKIEEYLRYLTEEPHIAGRDVDEKKLVEYIKRNWEDSGLHVEVHPYDVLLSYPNQTDSNLISIIFQNGTEMYKSQPSEKILDDSQISDKVVNPFNAYSATGDVEGHLVYVNYARVDDFIELTRDLGVDPAGHVCISRYGRIFRGSKAMIAQEYGCTGLILYSDPIDYTVPWSGVYPEDWYLPGTGAQRGNLHIVKGDPLTPQYPALPTAWRLYENETQLPVIPVTPIGYDDAVQYLARMGGNKVPDDWKGGLNITYNLGPGFEGELNDTSKIKMHVTTKNERAVAHNIFGYIKGDIEPDRYVLIGSHRDAWVFGAIDPSSSMATLIELARAMGVAVKNGWKPRRTIVFCSWGAEEYGLLGSTEWVEEFQKLLSSRAVAYLNVDSVAVGNYTLNVKSTPNMNELIYESTKFIKTPHPSEIEANRNTMYDTWAFRSSETNDVPPPIPTLGSGSDFTPFVQVTGISSMDCSYTYDESINIRSYPVYHSVYETFDLYKKFVDPDFSISRAVTQMMGEIARRLSDYRILPFNCKDYAAKLWEDKASFADAYKPLLDSHGIDLNEFDYALSNFTSAAEDIHKRIENLDATNEIKLRSINDQLMQLDRAFIDMNGIGERINFRHVIYAPSLHDTYASSAFPGLVDSLFDIEADPEQTKRWREVERQYSILLYHIGSAASTLREVIPVKGYSNY